MVTELKNNAEKFMEPRPRYASILIYQNPRNYIYIEWFPTAQFMCTAKELWQCTEQYAINVAGQKVRVVSLGLVV